MAVHRTQLPIAARQAWAHDFVFDACANNQQIKCLTVVVDFTRESLAIDVAGSIRSGRVIAVLSQLISLHGAPKILRSDNGPEFVSKALLRWASVQNLGSLMETSGAEENEILQATGEIAESYDLPTIDTDDHSKNPSWP